MASEFRERGAAVAVDGFVGQAGVPAAAGGGEEDVLEGGLGAAERAHAVAEGGQGGEELFAEVGGGPGHERGRAEAVGAAVTERGDLEGGLDGLELGG